ncbi:RlpA-like double-psi beta-barrel-protein domain-containing protein-containing protein [Spinellus fusiger]|nr:RlpA-like double-psi beta-barrel-protein domain-containing protein-containing protein [Spinellus fusiger]
MRFSTISIILSAAALVSANSKDLSTNVPRAERIVSQKRNQTFNGRATWFIPSTQGGSWGACGGFEADNAYIVALNAPQYGNLGAKSGYCGKKIIITSGKKSVTAVINDACPECPWGALDLTVPVFKALGNLDTGIIPISWHLA